MSLFRNDVSTPRRGLLARSAATATVLALVLALTPAQAAKTKVPKKKKNVDLSANPLGNVASRQPDKELYDKAMIALKKSRFDVARLDLQTLLNTYQESEYQMRAKLAVGDSWFKEGGTAALTQAEAEYKDFITFFPSAPEAAEAQMKVADIYYMQMEKPDRDFNNAVRAEQEYRNMINSFPDSTLVPRAKQKLREVQEVLGEREFLIGQYYASRENWSGAIARLQTVADTYPLYSHSDQIWLTIGDSYAGEARAIRAAAAIPGAVRERLSQVYMDKAAAAYAQVITHYSMTPHVEDARDRLIAMNRPVPEPTDAQIAESDAIERGRGGVHFTDKAIGIIKHGPVVVEASHVGDPTMTPPKRTIAPEINKQNSQLFAAAFKAGQPGAPAAEAATPAPTSNTEPPRSDRPQAPLQFDSVPTGEGSGTGISGSIVSAPNSVPVDPNAPVQPVKSSEVTVPKPEAAAEAPTQVNDIKTAAGATQPAATDPNAPPAKATKKKPKLDQSDESSSKKKKKKGLAKVNPF